MTGRHSPRLAMLTALALTAVTLAAADAQAQQTVSSRFRVLVPNFRHAEGGDKKFGEKLADELRELISELNTHVAVEEGDIKRELKKFDMKMEELDCIRARQLAQQTNYEVVMCATYSGPKSAYTVSNIQFVDVASGESFLVDDISSSDKEYDAAAQKIVQAFSLFVEQQRAAQFCGDYYASQQWENSLTQCERALELNPEAVSVRYVRASVLRETGRFEEALEEVTRILEADPYHQNALLLGGYLAIQLDQKERARGYYRNYLDLDPANASVRMNVAFQMAQEGDPLGGMELIEEGIRGDATNIDFYEQYGNFAFAAADQLRRERGDNGDDISQDVGDLYRKAIEAYGRVLDAKGGDMLVTQIRNVAVAHIQLKEYQEAIDFLGRALETHGDEAALWAVYGDALQKMDRVDDALAALAEVERIDPSWPSLHLRMASWMIEQGQFEDAQPVLRKAVENGATSDDAAQLIFAAAHGRYVAPDQKNYPRFIELVQMAKSFEVSERKREELDFWHAWGLFNRGIAMQAPETVASANRSLPIFQEALRLFQRSKGYADRQPQINYNQFVSAANQYIEIQEALIKRGR